MTAAITFPPPVEHPAHAPSARIHCWGADTPALFLQRLDRLLPNRSSKGRRAVGLVGFVRLVEREHFLVLQESGFLCAVS